MVVYKISTVSVGGKQSIVSATPAHRSYAVASEGDGGVELQLAYHGLGLLPDQEVAPKGLLYAAQ